MVLHIPHASTVIPPRVRRTLALSDAELGAELLVLTDAHTQHLFRLCSIGVRRVVYPVSRLVADPERFPDDALEPMAACGMGVVYTRSSRGRPLRRCLSAAARDSLLRDYYWPHHRRLTAAVKAELARCGSSLIVDCHSFPSSPLPHEPDQGPDRPDVCIGTDPTHTPEWLAQAAREAFGRFGYSVEMNRPYSGALVPGEFYRREPRVRSVMIELNRRLYMDEASGRRRREYRVVKGRLRWALRQLQAAEQGRASGG